MSREDAARNRRLSSTGNETRRLISIKVVSHPASNIDAPVVPRCVSPQRSPFYDEYIESTEAHRVMSSDFR